MIGARFSNLEAMVDNLDLVTYGPPHHTTTPPSTTTAPVMPQGAVFESAAAFPGSLADGTQHQLRPSPTSTTQLSDIPEEEDLSPPRSPVPLSMYPSFVSNHVVSSEQVCPTPVRVLRLPVGAKTAPRHPADNFSPVPTPVRADPPSPHCVLSLSIPPLSGNCSPFEGEVTPATSGGDVSPYWDMEQEVHFDDPHFDSAAFLESIENAVARRISKDSSLGQEDLLEELLEDVPVDEEDDLEEEDLPDAPAVVREGTRKILDGPLDFEKGRGLFVKMKSVVLFSWGLKYTTEEDLCG